MLAHGRKVLFGIFQGKFRGSGKRSDSGAMRLEQLQPFGSLRSRFVDAVDLDPMARGRDMQIPATHAALAINHQI